MWSMGLSRREFGGAERYAYRGEWWTDGSAGWAKIVGETGATPQEVCKSIVCAGEEARQERRERESLAGGCGVHSSKWR
jgi:hypothetical protein